MNIVEILKDIEFQRTFWCFERWQKHIFWETGPRRVLCSGIWCDIVVDIWRLSGGKQHSTVETSVYEKHVDENIE